MIEKYIYYKWYYYRMSLPRRYEKRTNIIGIAQIKYGSAGWGNRIHRLSSLQRGKTHHMNVDMTLNNLKLELWRMRCTPSLLPGQLWLRVIAPDRALSLGQIKLNCVLMQSWNAWNRAVFDIETAYLCSTEQFEIKLNCVLMLNWIIWNITVWHLTELFWHSAVRKPKTILILNWIVWNLIRR